MRMRRFGSPAPVSSSPKGRSGIPGISFCSFPIFPAITRRRWDGKRRRDAGQPSNKGNGMTYDAGPESAGLRTRHLQRGALFGRRGWRAQVLASHFEGKELNSPNDIVVDQDGSIYFTDPTYGRMPVFGVERAQRVGFPGVYRIAPGRRRCSWWSKKPCSRSPTGCAFSPDEKLLYVNDTEQTNIRVFDVADGKLKNMRVFASGITDPATPGAPDGMKCDAEGNIWVTGPGGLWVYCAQRRIDRQDRGARICRQSALGRSRTGAPCLSRPRLRSMPWM